MSGNVTIKAGTAYDAPWIVAEAPADGSAKSKVEAQRAYILAAFGMDPEDPEIKDLSLAEVVAQAGFHFQGVWSKAGGRSANVGGGRGRAAAKPKDEKPAQEPEAAASAPATEPATTDEAPAAEAASEPLAPEAVAEQLGAEIIEDTQIHEHQDVLDEIAAASDKKELQAIFHNNKIPMQDPEVLAALQARAKVL